MDLPLCVRVPADDRQSSESLRHDGWREVEQLETWAWNGAICERYACEARIRPAVPSDAKTCMWIASTGFTEDRLHRDPSVPAAAADLAKLQWVERAFSGDADRIFVADMGDPVGFLIAKKAGHGAVIDLLAVDRRNRRENIGKALVVAMLDHYGPVVTAGTSYRNRPARALYKSLGFELVAVRRTFHK